jgi:hypothetical protein
MTEPLSPAAQAVLDAFIANWQDESLIQDLQCLAAALRAAADHCESGELALTCLHSIHAIADELEAQ